MMVNYESRGRIKKRIGGGGEKKKKNSTEARHTAYLRGFA